MAGDKSCNGPWAAEVLRQQESGALEMALGCATSKRSNSTITPGWPLSKKNTNP